uniref:Uncharacterized protein n=1 Tax=Geospiza parvula TaxID=87175 RepID=A0A8U8AT41_GEOPR
MWCLWIQEKGERTVGTKMPAVLWDRVTLTCQGSGTAGATTWYKDGWRWWVKAPSHITVTVSGTYTCEKPSTGRSPPTGWCCRCRCGALLEGETVTLRCRGWQDNPMTSVSFYHEEKELQVVPSGTELSLSPLQLNHSGSYCCKGWVNPWGWNESAPVTVTVHGEHPQSPHPDSPTVTPQDTGTHRDTGGVTQGHQSVQDPQG